MSHSEKEQRRDGPFYDDSGKEFWVVADFCDGFWRVRVGACINGVFENVAFETGFSIAPSNVRATMSEYKVKYLSLIREQNTEIGAEKEINEDKDKDFDLGL